MKYLVCVALFAALLVVYVEAYTRCDGEDDCGEDECCVVRVILPFRKGNCKKLAALGKKCNTEDQKITYFGGKYMINCPCAKGLSCEPEDVKEIPILGKVKINERCVVGPTPTPGPEPTTEAETEPEPEATTEAEPEPEATTEAKPEPEPETEPASE